jgi:hypothetical protein
MMFFITLYVFKSDVKPVPIVQGFSLKDEHDLFDSVDHVEFHNVFTELTFFDLSVVQQVLNDESQHVRR